MRPTINDLRPVNDEWSQPLVANNQNHIIQLLQLLQDNQWLSIQDTETINKLVKNPKFQERVVATKKTMENPRLQEIGLETILQNASLPEDKRIQAIEQVLKNKFGIENISPEQKDMLLQAHRIWWEKGNKLFMYETEELLAKRKCIVNANIWKNKRESELISWHLMDLGLLGDIRTIVAWVMYWTFGFWVIEVLSTLIEQKKKISALNYNLGEKNKEIEEIKKELERAKNVMTEDEKQSSLRNQIIKMIGEKSLTVPEQRSQTLWLVDSPKKIVNLKYFLSDIEDIEKKLRSPWLLQRLFESDKDFRENIFLPSIPKIIQSNIDNFRSEWILSAQEEYLQEVITEINKNEYSFIFHDKKNEFIKPIQEAITEIEQQIKINEDIFDMIQSITDRPAKVSQDPEKNTDILDHFFKKAEEIEGDTWLFGRTLSNESWLREDFPKRLNEIIEINITYIKYSRGGPTPLQKIEKLKELLQTIEWRKYIHIFENQKEEIRKPIEEEIENQEEKIAK